MFDKTKQVKIEASEHIKLAESIFETEASYELLKQAEVDPNISESALKTIMLFYSRALREHKILWLEILVKYIGEDDASLLRDNLKYDLYKKVIFFQENQCDCDSCKTKRES